MEQKTGWFRESFLVCEDPLQRESSFLLEKEIFIGFVWETWAPAILLLQLFVWYQDLGLGYPSSCFPRLLHCRVPWFQCQFHDSFVLYGHFFCRVGWMWCHFLPWLYFVTQVLPKHKYHMDALLCLEGSRHLLLSHCERSRSYIHLQGLLKLLFTKNLFLKFLSIHRGWQPGTRKGDSWLVSTTDPLQNTFLASSFPIYKPSIFK